MDTTKPYKGMAMEGMIATWYAGLTRHESRHESMARWLAGKIQPGSRMLEIAPGPGYLSIQLARLGDYRVTGLDISQSFVEIARKNAARAGVAVDFRHGNASEMPFEDESFDFTICQAAFKNFTQPVKAIREMYRVLRPGGTAVIIDLRRDATTGNIEHYVQGLRISRVNRLMTRWTFQHTLLKNAYSVVDMEAMVLQTPFRQFHMDTDDFGFTLWLTK